MSEPEALHHRVFRDRTLRGSRFVGCDLRDVVVRGSELDGLELDSPWLVEEGGSLLVNGVDVVPLVDAELNRRFPGRELRRASDAAGLRDAWTAVERSWAATLQRARDMPDGTIDARVDGEWSLAETLRHLMVATDVWLGRAVLRLDEPFHPAGLPHTDGETPAFEGANFAVTPPAWADLLVARAGRQAMVRDYLSDVTSFDLAEPRPNPHAPDRQGTVLSCLHTILEEEWEHHRYAVRDLDVLAARTSP